MTMLLSPTTLFVSRQASLRVVSRRLFSSSEQQKQTQQHSFGRVKMWIRQKSYGFVVADHNGQDYFVHKSGIVGSDRSADNPSLPYLMKGERVRFTLGGDDDDEEEEEDGRHERATSVTYEDGSVIPLYRLGYVNNVKTYEMKVLGQRVYDILQKTGDDNNDTEEDSGEAESDDLLKRIEAAYGESLQAISDAQARFDESNGVSGEEVEDGDAEDEEETTTR